MYWSKGLFFNGRVFSFNYTLTPFCNDVYGLNYPTMRQFLYRFELNVAYYRRHSHISENNRSVLRTMNIIFSQISSINHLIYDIKKLNSIRLYLLKTSRGKAQALGKPSRGQRTWSNAWTAYFTNKVTRAFINQMQRELNKDKKEEKINFKILKKKTKRAKNTGVVRKKKKKKHYYDFNDIWN